MIKNKMHESWSVFWTIVIILAFFMVVGFHIISRGATITHDYSNGAYSTLASGITTTSTTLTVATGEGARFPNTADLIRVVVFSAACTQPSTCATNSKEWMDIRWSSGDTFDIVNRAVHDYEGGVTTEGTWAIGSKIQNPISAGQIKEYKDAINGLSSDFTTTTQYNSISGTVSALTNTVSNNAATVSALTNTVSNNAGIVTALSATVVGFATSFTTTELIVSRQSGTASTLMLYDAGTGTVGVVLQGPASGGVTYRIAFPNSVPTTTNRVLVVTDITSSIVTLGWTTM